MTTKHTREFPNVWADLMESVEAAVAAGERRSEVLAWAEDEYSAHCAEAHGEMYGPPEPTWDAAW